MTNLPRPMCAAFQLRTIMIVVCALAVAMVAIRLAVFLYASRMSMRLEGSNVLVGVDVVPAERLSRPSSGSVSFGRQVYVLIPMSFILISASMSIPIGALVAG